ncbi:MAG: mechanosensitive ion channel family protein, partial [Clostridiales bacterium]|nr:mechanosensitive ion channel family protein [Clostridiales bacterium]
MAQRTETTLDDSLIKGIRKYLVPLLYFGTFYLCTKVLYINPVLQKIINVITLAFIMIFGAVFLTAVLVFLFNKYWQKKHKDDDKLAVKWISIVIKVLIWAVALLLFLDNIDVKITALIAGLGVGGIAVAFALQAILEDLFSFVTIFFDRPFELDDFIIVGDLMGNVEHIGIKTTRVRSLSGEQLIFSNKDLTNSRLRNYKRMEKRRVNFRLGVTYDTPLEKLKEIPILIKEIIDDTGDCDFDRAHFFEFADFSLNFEIVYYILSQDYNIYMDVQQKINFRIKEEFEKRSIEFAFPT